MSWLQAVVVVGVIVTVGFALMLVGVVLIGWREAKNASKAWTHDESYLDADEHPQYNRENKE